MKKSSYNFNGRQRFILALLCVCVLTGISFLINYKTRAEAGSNNLQTPENNYSLKSFSVKAQSAETVKVGERVSPWLKLQQGKSPETTFYGKESAISAIRDYTVNNRSQLSVDFNFDGYPDLIGGFSSSKGGGVITLHRGNKEAFEPKDAQVLANLKNGIFPAAFEKDSVVVEVPFTPDFMVSGKFVKDSPLDLVIGSRGGHSLYLMTSDGNGGFNAPLEINLKGEITAMAADSFNNSDSYTGLAVALDNEGSSGILVFNGKDETFLTQPFLYSIEGSVRSLILANSDNSSSAKDLYGLADGSIFTISRVGISKSAVKPINLSYRVADFAVGEFIRDRQAKAEIAVLSEDGTVSYLQNGTLDTRPFTAAEMQEAHRRGFLDKKNISKPETKNAAGNWTESESHFLGVFAVGDNPAKTLRKAYITGDETDDLLVVNSQTKRVEILFKEPNNDQNRNSFTSETKFQSIDFAETPESVLPMRLNVMGQQGFVYFSKGSLEPIAITAAPNATFTVTKTADTNDGVCNADCSLREAVVAANTAAGADMITFTPNGTHQLTINNAGVENAAAEGDLDVTQSLTVVGNGTANTIVQAGTNTTNGIDKVFSINPLFTSAFATSISNLTMRFGRNPSSFAVDGYGGAMDWEASGTGTLTLSGVNVDSNTATDGVGGGIAGTNSNAGAGLMTLTNVNVTNNTAQRVAATGNFGGGIFAGINMSLAMTTVTISNNSLTNANSFGGGIYLQSNTNGSSTFNGLTVTGNSVTGNGGGIYTVRGLTINAPIIISTNTATGSGSTGFGGGIYMNSNASVNLSKATMVGNSAAVNGGAIALGSGTGAAGNTLNMSFSRIVGNTSGGFTGLVTSGGTANVENNWWGCNTGPSAAPCDTAGTSGGGSVDFDPWLRFTHTANPTSIVVGQTSTLTASFLTNSNNQAIAASNLDVLIGLPITFNNAVRGTISNAQATIQSSGTATATFTGTSVGAGSANAVVDNGTATANITIAQAATMTTITSDNPDPSSVGQAVTVTYTVTVNSPGAGTPTGNVTVSDGVNSCTGTVAAGSCAITLNTPGARTLTATYAGDTNFTGSTSAGVSHTVQITADLAITKTDGVTSVTAGGSTTYTITATNAGPNAATGATVTDTFPAALTCTFTATYNGGATGPASGSGNINAAVNLPSNSSASFTANCTISASATGILSNTATVTAPANDPNQGNNSATDTDSIAQSANLAITKTDGVTTVTAGGSTTYTITASNAGPSNAAGATVTDTFPATLTATWTCVGAGGGTCTASGAGNINQTVNLPSGGSVTFTVSATVSASASGTLSNTATVTAPAGVTDPTPGNNSATDSDTILVPTAAAVEVSGRVLTNSGRAISNARVTITDQAGNSRLTTTSAFGYFRFGEVQTGETYIISVNSKRYGFAPQVISLTGDLTDLNFVAQE